jgi:two-component system nitrate/nitrite response regulator NarL
MSKTAVGHVRILILDDHVLFRESLARLLQSEAGLTVAGHCSSCSEAARILKSRHVDVVLLDLDLGHERGEDFLESLQNLGFQGKVLVVTAGVNERDVPALIRKGIAGILMKHNSPALLVQGIRDAMRGKIWFEQDMLRRSLVAVDVQPSSSSRSRLTSREKTVLSFVFEGLSNKEIADRIEVSESAVKSCLQHLFTKTGVRTRSQLVRVALEQYRDEL